MSTTALDVDSRDLAPSSEQGVLDLAQYTLEEVRRDVEFVLFRGLRSGHKEGSPSSILVQVPVADPPSPVTVRSLQEDYALRSELDPAYVVRSLSMVQTQGRPMLILEDPTGTPLDLLLNGAMDIAQFLRLAIHVAAALDHVHGRGLVHRDIKPANILVNAARDPSVADGPGRCITPATRAPVGPAFGVPRRDVGLHGPRTDWAHEPLDRCAQRSVWFRRHVLRNAHRDSAIYGIRSDGIGALSYGKTADTTMREG